MEAKKIAPESKSRGNRVTAGLEAALGYAFNRPELLLHALTHRSLAHEQQAHIVEPESAKGEPPDRDSDLDGNRQISQDNERLEFLGDAVLGMVVAEALYAAYPRWTEGELTRIRAQLVSRAHMAKVGASIRLGSYLLLGYGEEHSGGRRKAAILANSMEAVLAALYLDGGLEPVRAFVQQQVLGRNAEQLAEGLRSGEALGDHKSALQEHLQAEKLGSPIYAVRGESGPDHRKRFLVEVRLKESGGESGIVLATGQGRTKKRAEQAAARRALARMVKSEDADFSDETEESEIAEPELGELDD